MPDGICAIPTTSHLHSQGDKVMTVKIFGRVTVAVFIAFFFVIGFSLPAFSADCSQKRKTPQAPGSAYNKKNPLKSTPENISAGEKLYIKGAKPLACVKFHEKTVMDWGR